MSIGRLEEVPLREIWPHEGNDFTPWLAKPKNLEYLGEVIGIDFDMDSIKTEYQVGSLSIDILAEDELGHKVIIENQLERTDHSHLGQCIAYAAGIGASVIVWIAKDIHDQHRGAVEFLNRISNDDFNLFLVKLGAVRIGDSPPAPMLDVIESPNNWAKIVREIGRDSTMSDTKLRQLALWEDVRAYGQEHASLVSSWQKPPAQHWYTVRMGYGGIHIDLNANSRTKEVSVNLYIDTGNKEENKEIFHRIEQMKDEIEAELGELRWWELPEKRASIITKAVDIDFLDESKTGEAVKWLVENTDAFINAFRIDRKIV